MHTKLELLRKTIRLEQLRFQYADTSYLVMMADGVGDGRE